MKLSTALVAAIAVALFAASAVPAAQAVDDVDILNFALNLEYLEAEFYQIAVYGRRLSSKDRGGGPSPTGGSKTPLSKAIYSIGREIADDELKHVKFLRLALGAAAVPQPKLNIGSAFGAAADAALKTTLKPSFSPYRKSGNDLLFLHGAFIFEDVGVTAYKGAANLIASKNYLQYAAGILAVEAYHAGTVRTLLFMKASTKVAPYGATVSTIVSAIAKLRASVSGGGNDQGILRTGGWANIVPTNGNSIVFGRTTSEVINIVTLNGANNKGGFFPNGLNGGIK